jgi:hypothetical protein
MDIKLVFVLLGFFAASSALADAYTWTDENGVVHYSDRPNPGAKRIRLDSTTTVRQLPARATASAADNEPAPAPFAYQTLEVNSPASEETLWNIETELDVELTLSPELRSGHQVRVYFDGKAQIMNSTAFTLEEVYRGAHNLQVEVIDETGKLMIRNHAIRFYVQQNSVY